MFDFECLRKRDQRDHDEDIEMIIRSTCQQHSIGQAQTVNQRRKKLKTLKQTPMTMWEVLDQPTGIRIPSLPRINKSKSSCTTQTDCVGNGSESTGSTDESKEAPAAFTQTTSHSFKNRGFSQKWKERDTKLFFKALSLFGTDFSMIALIFRARDRSQLINKYHKEERDNPKRVEAALKTHRQGSSHVLKRCSRILENTNNGLDTTVEIKTRVRGGSASSLDSLDQLIFDELDVQIGRGSKLDPSPSCGSPGQP